MRRLKDSDCIECFMKGCICTCSKCLEVKERNYWLLQSELDDLNTQFKKEFRRKEKESDGEKK